MKSIRIELKWALIFFVAGLLWMFFEKSMGWHDELIEMHPTYTNFIAPIADAIYVFALLDKRKQLQGFMNWKQGFVSGAIVTMIVALLTPLSQYLTHEIISPTYFQNAINYSVESGNATLEEAEAFFTIKSYAVQAFIGALLMGLVTSAIVAFFVKKS